MGASYTTARRLAGVSEGGVSHRVDGSPQPGVVRLLVYEFRSDGTTVHVGLFEDVAQGLRYLHDGLNSRVIHCDVKPQNILVDEAAMAKMLALDLSF